MSNYNKIIIVGHLGRDPELKTYREGEEYCTFSVANNDPRDKEHTEWYSVTVSGKQARPCAEYLSKGRLVLVEGRHKTYSYNKDGEMKHGNGIKASSVQFLGGKDDKPKQPKGASEWGKEDDLPF